MAAGRLGCRSRPCCLLASPCANLHPPASRFATQVFALKAAADLGEHGTFASAHAKACSLTRPSLVARHIVVIQRPTERLPFPSLLSPVTLSPLPPQAGVCSACGRVGGSPRPTCGSYRRRVGWGAQGKNTQKAVYAMRYDAHAIALMLPPCPRCVCGVCSTKREACVRHIIVVCMIGRHSHNPPRTHTATEHATTITATGTGGCGAVVKGGGGE